MMEKAIPDPSSPGVGTKATNMCLPTILTGYRPSGTCRGSPSEDVLARK